MLERLLVALLDALAKPRSATADERRIARLEYELGFSDTPPPSRAQSMAAASAFLKEVWTDAPGAVIEYDPAEYDPSNPFGRAALLRHSYAQAARDHGLNAATFAAMVESERP